MPGPSITFAFMLSTLLGAIFHLIAGGDARRLALFLLAGWVGFGLGQFVGITLGISAFNIGGLRIVAAVLGAIIALFATHFLTRNRNYRHQTG